MISQAINFSYIVLLFSTSLMADPINTLYYNLPANMIDKPIEIIIDRWGVPHIYATNENDAFFAQGFNAARDRLFQIDLFRRRGLGQLSEVFGPTYIEQDKATRLFLYRGDMDTEWQKYAIDSQNIAKQFVAGINAYIDWVLKNLDQLPFEFNKMNYLPSKWSASDIVRIRSHGRARNLTSEVERANVACQANLSIDTLRIGLEPPWVTQLPEGLDPCLPNDVLNIFKLATEPFRLSQSIAASHDDQNKDNPDTLEGSNNWVISPHKSSTGRAIMANDPHRAYTIPSMRYIVHINTPTLNIIGAGEPSLPGISIGHNGKIAFGLTIFAIDQEDLYVYQLNPKNPNQYFYKGGWEEFNIVREKINVLGGESVYVDLRFSRHGPIIYNEIQKNRAFAVRSAWLEPGMAPYFNSIGYIRAKNFNQFQKAMRNWGAPGENLVYADTEGNIGWVTGGLAPIRTNWDGLLPVPGDGRYEWAGYWSWNQLPSDYNPKKGYLTSSNEMNLPKNHPYGKRKLGFEWSNSSRHQRIETVLSSSHSVSIEDSIALQNDITSLPASRLIKLLSTISGQNENEENALKLLKDWEAKMKKDSKEAALHEVWVTRHLGAEFKQALLSHEESKAFNNPDMAVMLSILENPAPSLGNDAERKRDNILRESLGAAYQEMVKLQGNSTARWRWGDLLYNLTEHPFSNSLTKSEKKKINIGPLSVEGSLYTPNQAAYQTDDFRQINGASFRIIVDVGEWDNSRAINFPGQSGNTNNPHYNDLVTIWQRGEYFPLLYTHRAIEAASETKIILVPTKQQ